MSVCPPHSAKSVCLIPVNSELGRSVADEPHSVDFVHLGAVSIPILHWVLLCLAL